jgi:hypothetical protein
MGTLPRHFKKADATELARLVRRYTRERIIAIAQTIETSLAPPPPGRPRTWNSIEMAEWFEERVQAHRNNGSGKPVADAERDWYLKSVPAAQRNQPGHFLRWQPNFKKKRLKAVRELERLRRRRTQK